MVQTVQIDPKRLETLGPAERVVQTLTTYLDHAVHNRPGIVIKDTSTPIGVKWVPATWKLEGAEGTPQQKVAYELTKVGKKSIPVRRGVLQEDGKTVKEGNVVVGEYRKPGLYPEAVAYMYRQIAEVWKLDNEFAAHLASWSFPKEHRDLKVVLAAFMLVQSRSGEPVMDNGKVAFHDDDFRAIGEAMLLNRGSKNDFNPKLMLRVGDVLAIPQIAEINRTLGFGKSAREAPKGRYTKAMEKWLKSLESNPKALENWVKGGFRTSVMEASRRVGYKPTSQGFFATLRWKQKQAGDGRRVLAIGQEVAAAESWEGLTEKKICQKITKDKPNFKRLVGLLPASVGLTRAVMAAAIEANCLSDADLIIMTPTLEELGLLAVPEFAARWKTACDKATNQRAANIARNVKLESTVEALTAASDNVAVKVMEEVTKGLRVYVMVDKSGSMERSLELAKEYLTKFLGGFPLDRTHVSVFNTSGSEIVIKAASSVAVDHAFKGHSAAGGTDHASGLEVLISKYKPADDEDALFIFVGDEGETHTARLIATIRRHGVLPVGFGLLKVPGQNGSIVQDAARELGVPCFMIDQGIFADPYAITRTLRNLIATTPVGLKPVTQIAPRVVRKTLVQEILETPLLTKPIWA